MAKQHTVALVRDGDLVRNELKTVIHRSAVRHGALAGGGGFAVERSYLASDGTVLSSLVRDGDAVLSPRVRN